MARGTSEHVLPSETDRSAEALVSRDGPSHRASTTRRLVTVGAILVVVVVVAIGLIALERADSHASAGGASRTLLPSGELISISPEQYYGVEFVSNSSGTLNTTYSSIYPTPLYIMTPHEYYVMIFNYTVIGYEWTLTTLGDGAVQYLDLALPAGEWWFAMANPSPINTTAVGLLTPLTLTPG